MDRPLAGRGAVAQLDRILDYHLPLRGRRPAKRRRAARWPGPPGASRPWQLLRAGIDRASGAAAPLWRRRRLRLASLAAVVMIALLSVGWLWFRHSSLVAVRGVRIVGLHGPESGAINAALQTAARHMSTLDVHPAALRAAVAPFPVVREVRAHASFPHGLVIHVIEQSAVAALSAAGVKTAVAANGVVLGQELVSGSLPAVSAGWAPPPGQRVGESAVREVLSVLGAVPAPLAHFVQRAYSGPKGVTVVMHSGLSAYFGDASRPHAKWLALALVISNERANGASYVDVRVPERPAAGFAPGTAPPSASAESGSSGEHSATPESVAASIAARLAAAVGVGEGPSSQKRSGGESGESQASSESASASEAHTSGEAHTSSESGASSESSAGSEHGAGSEAASSATGGTGH